MTDADMQTACQAADLRDVGAEMQRLLGRDMTLEFYLNGGPSPQTLADLASATVLIAKADAILRALGVSTAKLYE